MKKYILIEGNPVDGMNFAGPFVDAVNAADEGAERERSREAKDWWVAELEAPTTTQDDSKATPEEIERARDKYALGSNDDIEIDDNALASRADEGTWVQAWVWLPA